MPPGQACSGCSTDTSQKGAVSAGQKGGVGWKTNFLGLGLPILIHLGKLRHAERAGPGVVGWGWSQGSLKGVMSPQVWQDRSDRNSRMPQELRWCTLLGLQVLLSRRGTERMEAAPAGKGEAGI